MTEMAQQTTRERRDYPVYGAQFVIYVGEKKMDSYLTPYPKVNSA